MNLSQRVLGLHTVTTLRERVKTPVLVIGKDRFTRNDLASVECYSFIAAYNLTRVLKALGATSTRDVFDTISPSSLALPRLGAVAVAVLGAAFEQKHLGGDSPLESWMEKHREGVAKHTVVTFDSIKHTASREAREDKKR